MKFPESFCYTIVNQRKEVLLLETKNQLFLVLVCAFWSCAGALADGFLSPGSSEVTAAFDAAGLKYSQLDISNSGDVFRISYAPATSTQLDSIVVTIHVMESSATVLGPSIGDIDTSDMLSLYQALESLNDSVSFIRFIYDTTDNYIYSSVEIPYLENADFGEMVERYAYITALVVDQHYSELAALKK